MGEHEGRRGRVDEGEFTRAGDEEKGIVGRRGGRIENRVTWKRGKESEEGRR